MARGSYFFSLRYPEVTRGLDFFSLDRPEATHEPLFFCLGIGKAAGGSLIFSLGIGKAARGLPHPLQVVRVKDFASTSLERHHEPRVRVPIDGYCL